MEFKLKRKFAMTMYKNLKLKLGEMSFAKDFVNDTRGNLYPPLEKSNDCVECVETNCYVLKKGHIKRMVCQFFPYATYELTTRLIDGKVGFCFNLPNCEATVFVSGNKLVYMCGEHFEEKDLPDYLNKEFTLIISCRPNAFDIYFKNNNKAEFFCTFVEEKFENSHKYPMFSNGYAALYGGGNVVVKEVVSYIDNGISTADMRPIRYENGEIMIEQGKVYITATIRMQEEMFQGVFSWVPGTAEFELTGAMFYDSGDGKWCGDVAASVLYNRTDKRWYLWVCSFSHNHILGHSVFDGDPRFGVNVIDIKLMEMAMEDSVISDFAGFEGDEDPDFFYDENKNKWLMAICRLDPDTDAYRYFFFESDKPFDGYTCIGKGLKGAETGGSFVKINGKQLFVCGNDFNATSDYRIYSKEGMTNAEFDYPDGGFRGWGTLMPVKMGSRTRYFWLTFDRHNASSYNWSYGNIYCFECDV